MSTGNEETTSTQTQTAEVDEALVEEITDALKDVIDPELGVNVVDLGLVYGVNVDERSIVIDMTLTAPGCGMGEFLVQDIREKLLQVPNVTDVNVELTFDPPWNQDMMSEAARLQTGMY